MLKKQINMIIYGRLLVVRNFFAADDVSNEYRQAGFSSGKSHQKYVQIYKKIRQYLCKTLKNRKE